MLKGNPKCNPQNKSLKSIFLFQFKYRKLVVLFFLLDTRYALLILQNSLRFILIVLKIIEQKSNES